MLQPSLTCVYAVAEETCKITGRKDEEVSLKLGPFPLGLYPAVCSRMATKLLRLTADEKKEAKRDGQSLSGESVVSHCLHCT